MDRQALASSASSLSNTGAPSPAGTLRATTSTTPPTLLPVRLHIPQGGKQAEQTMKGRAKLAEAGNELDST
jgi:hypothetical protein